MMNLQAELVGYLERLKGEGYAPATLEIYGATLAKFLRYLRGRECSAKLALNYVGKYSQKLTRYNMLLIIRKFFRHLAQKGIGADWAAALDAHVASQKRYRFPKAPEAETETDRERAALPARRGRGEPEGPPATALLGWVNRYVEELRLLRRSPDTIKLTRYTLRRYAAFAGSEPADASYDAALRFLDQFQNKGTRVTMAVHIKSFVRFMALEGACKDWTPRLITKFKRAERHNTLSDAEIEAMLATCDNSFIGRRDYTLLILYSHTAARRDEIRTLKVTDLDLENSRFTNFCKGGTDSIFHLTPIAKKALEDWLKIYGGGRYLFRGVRGVVVSNAPIHRSSISTIINRAADRAGIARNVHAHMFRHSTAQRLLDAGHSIETVGKVLHHQSLASTMVYAKVRDRTAAEALDSIFGKETQGPSQGPGIAA